MKDLTKGKESKLIFYFALPLLIGNVFQQLYNIIDSVIVGKFLGKEALAAVGAAFPVLFVLVSLIIGITNGGTIVISQFYGAKKIDKVKTTIDTLYITLFFSSIIITIFGLLVSATTFRMLKVPLEVFDLALIYMNIYILGIIFIFGINGTAAILRGLGDSKTPLYFFILGALINIVFDILFVLVFKWGLTGVAIAAVLSQLVTFITFLIYINKTHSLIKITFRRLQFDKTILKEIVRIGLPNGLQQSFVAFGMIALLRFVNNFGTDAVAAYTAAGRIDAFASLPAMNFSFALTAFIGQNIGANKQERIKKGLYATLIITAIISLSITLLTVLFRFPLMALFTNDANIIKTGAHYLIIVCSFYIMFSTLLVMNGLFRGAGDTLIPMFITLFSLWVIRIPLSWFLTARIGVDGVWWSIPMAWAIGMVFSIIYYYKGNWKNKAVTR